LGVSRTIPSPILSPKAPIFGVWIGILKPNSHNIQTCILSKLISTKFALWQRPSYALCGWSRYTQHKSKMVDGHHLRKIESLPYLSNGLTDCHAVMVRWCSLALLAVPHVKILRFKKSKMTATAIWIPPSWKIEKSPCLSNGLTDLN